MSNQVKIKATRNRCKCCLRERLSKDLWSAHFYNGQTERYGLMLSDCFSLSWSEPSEMERICHPCIGRLRDAYYFKKQILDAQEFLSRIADDDEVNIEQQLEEFLDKHLNIPYGGNDQRRVVKTETSDFEDDDENQDGFTEVEFLEMDADDKIEEESELQTIVLVGDTVIKKVENESSSVSAITPVNTRKRAKETVGKVHVVKQNEHETRSKSAKDKNKVQRSRKPPEDNKNLQGQLERKKHQENIAALFLSTNATPVHSKRDNGYECGFCGTFYLVPAELKKHIIQDHTDQEKEMYMSERELYHLIYKVDITNLQCNYCGDPIKDVEAAWPHLASHNVTFHTDIKNCILPYKFESDVYQCFKCGERFARIRALNSHMNVHYQNYMCQICGNGFLTRHLMLIHSRFHEDGTFQCSYCPKTFNVRIKWRMHEKNHQYKRATRMTNICGFCGERFNEISKKYRHLEVVHGVAQTMYECETCGKRLASKKSFNNHMQNVHLKVKRYQCPMCDKECFDHTNMTRHIRNNHSSDKGHRCGICHKLFKRESAYKLHMQVHKGKHHMCELCSETFILKTGLISHLKSKHGVDHENIEDDDL